MLAKNFLGLFTGLALGFLSSIVIPVESPKLNVFEARVLARILPEGLRFPKPGLEQFSILVLDSYQLENQNNSPINNLLGSKFKCRAISLPWRNMTANTGDLIILQASFHFFSEDLWPWDYDAQQYRRGYAGTCKLQYIARLGFTNTTLFKSL